MKKGLVLEGGSMRGMFSAGVMDVFMENDIAFDGAVGTSAGATFGCNYKSKQIGRSIRYNVKYCKDPRYASFRSLIFTGNIFNKEFAFSRLPHELDVFDTKTYKDNPMKFYVVATDVMTGGAVYHECPNGDDADIEWMRASSAMPGFSQIVEIDGLKLLDGGVADSIALKYFESIGYEKNVVILTQPDGFVKSKNPLLPILKITLGKYPNMVKACAERHIIYNETINYIKERAKSGQAYVIYPEKPLDVGRIEHNPDKLKGAYEEGRRMGEKHLEKVRRFLLS